MFQLRQSHASDAPKLFKIWQASVEATHHFLTNDDLQNISIQVEEYLKGGIFSVVTFNDEAVAFMGMTENKIDSLFVAPEFFGKGVGKILIESAKKFSPELFVDVNEANEGARMFYEKAGFRIFHRTEKDDEGRPLPLLKMKYSSSGMSAGS